MDQKGQGALFDSLVFVLIAGIVVAAFYPFIAVTWGLNFQMPNFSSINGLIGLWPLIFVLAIPAFYLFGQQRVPRPG